MTTAGIHDRRGFVIAIRLSFVVILVGLVLLTVSSWKVGLAVALCGCCCFVVLEAVSAPPVNSASHFVTWSKQQQQKRPVLLCIGDSLTHGTCSSSYTPELPRKLAERLGLPLPSPGRIFGDPIWVVNAGQNHITTHTILYEQRLAKALLSCHPDFVLIMIGTNDIRGVYSSIWGMQVTMINGMPEVPTMHSFERNLAGILHFLYTQSPLVRVGVCTLPPMGENLHHTANKFFVREANTIIRRVVAEAEGRVSVVPIYEHMEAVLVKSPWRRFSLPVDAVVPVACVICTLYTFVPFLNYNIVSSLFGNVLLSDCLHLNERGRDIVVEAVVTWLVDSNVAKAISPKST